MFTIIVVLIFLLLIVTFILQHYMFSLSARKKRIISKLNEKEKKRLHEAKLRNQKEKDIWGKSK